MATDYVGLDQSYTGFGAVVLHEDGYESFLGKFDQTKWKTQRLYAVEDWLYDNVVPAASADRVVILREGYSMASRQGREMAGELGGLVNSVVYDWIGRDPILVAPSTLKKFITGKGTGVGKNQILLSVYKKWGADFSNDNVADAYGLAQLGRALWDDSSNLTKYEREVLATVRKADPDL